MIRTQVFLTEEQVREIKLRAHAERRAEAEVIRELLDRGLSAVPQHPRETAGESLLRLSRIGGQGPADLSSRLDDYLYGTKK